MIILVCQVCVEHQSYISTMNMNLYQYSSLFLIEFYEIGNISLHWNPKALTKTPSKVFEVNLPE